MWQGGATGCGASPEALDDYDIGEDQRERLYTSNFNQLLGSHA